MIFSPDGTAKQTNTGSEGIKLIWEELEGKLTVSELEAGKKKHTWEITFDSRLKMSMVRIGGFPDFVNDAGTGKYLLVR